MRRQIGLKYLTIGEGLETGVGAVEDVLVAGKPSVVGVLPESVEIPTSRKGPRLRRVTGNEQRVCLSEASIIARAAFPPVRGRVDRGIPLREGMHTITERSDPTNH